MKSAREEFLERVRNAVASGNKPGESGPIPVRGTIGYQGGGADLAVRFSEELVAAGGTPHLVPDSESAVIRLLELLRDRVGQRVLLGSGSFIDSLALPERLRSIGLQVLDVDSTKPVDTREKLFAADVGITGVDYLIAETGTIVLLAKPSVPRSFSLLPPLHIALAERKQLVPDLFDLFESSIEQENFSLPSALTLITGPSKTGDIELRLVTGVHGPGEVHVILVGA